MSERRKPDCHTAWLSLDDFRLRLLDDWCELQLQLERQDDWFGLSDAARAAAEKASGLVDLHTRLRLIDRRLRCWLRSLPANPADDVAAVAVRLQIAERLLPAEESPVVHKLIARAVGDLNRLQGR
jgi:hypothetical protein